MRAIETESVREKREKRAKLIMGIVLIVLMVGSSAGYAVSWWLNSDSTDDLTLGVNPEYNGQYWAFMRNGYPVALVTSPDEVANISVNVVKTVADYQAMPLYLDSESDVVVQELASNLGPYALRIQEACYGECINSTLPVKDCTENVIVWRASEQNRVYGQGKCVFIDGDIRAVDAFLYSIFKT